ncbi:MAG TPA: crosslink repair DNA glycosylase YcaQ family protein, partial [Thermoanaerobaculia bacterium]|nr:crosslink repair DNA glycosylase YcaQ family protein [Thermoanaerobaculia bacterium]
KQRLAHARIDGVDWFWPADERPEDADASTAARLLAPFDPVVWDRARFEIFWGWGYRFEAYTPESKRKLGYYALPLLWKDRVIGWGNVALRGNELHAKLSFVGPRPRDRELTRAINEELERLRGSLIE